MKNKLFVFTSLVTLSVTLLSGCNSSCSHDFGEWHADKELGQHVRYCSLCGKQEIGNHNYDKTGKVLTPASCMSDGVVIHECDICQDTYETTLPKLTNHDYRQFTYYDENNHIANCSSCGKTQYQSHEFNIELPNAKYLKSEATCNAKATYYKSCKCGASSGNTYYEETFEYGSYAKHNIWGLTIKSQPTKKTYYSLQQIDPAGLVLTYKCYNCQGKTFEATAEDGITFEYEHKNNSFRVGETSVKAYFMGKNFSLTGFTVLKNSNELTGLENITTTCNKVVDLNNIKSKFGKTIVKVFDKDEKLIESSNLKYQLLESGSPYRIEAEVIDTPEYAGISTQTASITVSHLYELGLNDLGYSQCSCSTLPVEKYFYDTNLKQLYLPALFGEKKDLVLNGTVVDAQTNKEPNFSKLEGGAKQLLKATLGDEVIYFQCIGLNRVLTTESDLNTYLYAQDVDVSGYFVLGNDIESWTALPFTSHAPNNTTRVNNYGGCYFTCTFDGCGHHIKKINITNETQHGSLFGTRKYGGSLFKDLYIDSFSTSHGNGGFFGYTGDDITLEGCYIKYTQSNTCSLSGLLQSTYYINNCVFDFGNVTGASICYQRDSGNIVFTNTKILYNDTKNQSIFNGVTTKHSESGVTWIKTN